MSHDLKTPPIELSILMPCLNEAETLATCIKKALKWIASTGVNGEVIIADNGSNDGSPEIAQQEGARVVHVPKKGYGSALFHGAKAARGEYIIMGDSDDSCAFDKMDELLQKLREGFDLVMGNRFRGGIKKGAMPWKNRFIGNPFLSWLGRKLFRCSIGDFHCGFRGFRKDAFERMDLRTTGMEFASEMIIKANLFGMRIAEVPTVLSKDGRSRPPHLRPWRDGWRHLRFMMLFSPKWLFIIPGLSLFSISLPCYILLMRGALQLGQIIFDIHTIFFMQAGMILGFLAASLGLIVNTIGIREGLLPKTKAFEKIYSSYILEIGSGIGFVIMIIGLLIGSLLLSKWSNVNFGTLVYGSLLRYVSLSSSLIILGGMTVFLSLVMGFLSLPMKNK